MSKPLDEKTEFRMPDGAEAEIEAIVGRYPTTASAIMPCLWVFMDALGYVPAGAVDYLSGRLEITRARVYEVLSFYTMYRTEPQAEYVLQVCHNISCHIMGARNIIAHLEKRLGIRLGEMTPDGKFAIEGAECLGACGHGPCMQLGRHLYEYLTVEKVDTILDSLRKGEIPRADTDRELEA